MTTTEPVDQSISPENDPIFGLDAPLSHEKPGQICFAGRGTGLYRSDDGGQTWENVFHKLFRGQMVSATVVASSPNFDHDHTVFTGLNGGVLRSMDGGHTWRATLLPPPEPSVVALAISPNFGEDDYAFAGTAEDGVLFSSDGGVTWVAWNFGLLDMNILCLAISPNFAKDETLFAGTTTGLFASHNGGRAWRALDLPVDMPAVISLAVSPHFAVDRMIYVGTEAHGLFRSTRGSARAGLRWEVQGGGSLDFPVNAILLDPAFPEVPEVLVLHGSELLISHDQGGTFQKWTPPGLSDSFEATAAALSGSGTGVRVLVGGADGTVLTL